jgi:Flp pilus assembly protein TadG
VRGGGLAWLTRCQGYMRGEYPLLSPPILYSEGAWGVSPACATGAVASSSHPRQRASRRWAGYSEAPPAPLMLMPGRLQRALNRLARPVGMPPRQRRRQRAQSMVETALVLPIFLVLLFMTVDLARATYTWVMMGQDAQSAARQAALNGNQTSDCSAITGAVTAGNGVTLTADPKSIINNGSPSASPAPWTAPTQANAGYLYIYPAQATANPPASNCSNASPGAGSPARPAQKSVTAIVNFNFVPWTPLVSQLLPKIVISAQATEQSQY